MSIVIAILAGANAQSLHSAQQPLKSASLPVASAQFTIPVTQIPVTQESIIPLDTSAFLTVPTLSVSEPIFTAPTLKTSSFKQVSSAKHSVETSPLIETNFGRSSGSSQSMAFPFVPFSGSGKVSQNTVAEFETRGLTLISVSPPFNHPAPTPSLVRVSTSSSSSNFITSVIPSIEGITTDAPTVTRILSENLPSFSDEMSIYTFQPTANATASEDLNTWTPSTIRSSMETDSSDDSSDDLAFRKEFNFQFGSNTKDDLEVNVNAQSSDPMVVQNVNIFRRSDDHENVHMRVIE